MKKPKIKAITSLNNPVVKKVIALRKSKKRKGENRIIIEGKKEIEMAAQAGFNITTLFVCDELTKGREKLHINKVVLYKTDIKVMKKIAYRENPDAYLAIAIPKTFNFKDIEPKDDLLLVILEAVEKPGNLGAILRSADASGVDAIIINNKRTDIFNPNVIRASLGAVFSVPVIISDIEETLIWLKSNNIKSFAATPHTSNLYHNEDYKNSVAFVVGTEHEGLSEDWLGRVDKKVQISMNGQIDSLNASVSAAILLYEAVRQRQ